MAKPAFSVVATVFAVAVVFSILLIVWNRRRQMNTGKRFPAYLLATFVVLFAPAVAMFFTGFPVQWELPVLRGFNFVGGITVLPELIALWLALTLYRIFTPIKHPINP